MGLSEVGVVLDLTVVSTGAGATASKAGCADEDEEDASADLLEEKGQTMMARYVWGFDVCDEVRIGRGWRDPRRS